MPSAAENQKRALRAQHRERRQNLPARERERASAGITQNLQSLVLALSARSVACYLSSPTEPDTRPFLRWAQESGIRTLYPVSRDDGLLDWTVGEDGVELVGLHGEPQASGELLGPIAINDVDLIVVPASAVDLEGGRLGWGRGYYDKTLGSMERRPPTYAVVFDHEVVDAVTREVHDEPVSGVVTPTRILDFT